MCGFLGGGIWGRPPEFTRLRLAIVSGSTRIQKTNSKTKIIKNPKLVRNCIFPVKSKSGSYKKLYLSFRGDLFSPSEYHVTKIASTPKKKVSKTDIDYFRNSIHTTYLKLPNLTSEKGLTF